MTLQAEWGTIVGIWLRIWVSSSLSIVKLIMLINEINLQAQV